MTDDNTWNGIISRLETWFSFADREDVILATLVVLAVFSVRKALAGMVISGLNKMISGLTGGLPENARIDLKNTVSILLVVGAAYVAIELVSLPDFADGFVRRVLASIALIAVFSGWYNLCGPMVSLLGGSKRLGIKIETTWMKSAARFGVILFGIAALLKIWHVDISGAMTGVGVLGAGVAIAAQDLIRNLVAGMNNQSEKRFAAGDVIEIEGNFIGVVEQVDLRSTILRGFDQIPRYIPNSDLSNAVVLNYSQLRNRRVKRSIGFVLSCSAEQIRDVLAALKDHLQSSGDFDLSDGAPQYVNVEGLSNSAISIMFYARTLNADYQNYLDIDERLTLKILEISRQFGATLAYPTQTVELKNSPDQDLLRGSN
ncbi:mechanosensitive ion channel family protein [Pelagimonas varians]|uniref:Low conductance mechanosensitive channel YnaI n=1 Tax=Pelagimonas varians TaxID=696760 RepID=A0A238KWJ0_9RHOB|nr:mechanosensitive ion channel family protein [Pelagimonas varians]PYG28005.1 small-conductance mechanosensitive channel [Pelagimonas varians]SMX47077.1 Low conductance mechanosensitive channel YnaI [Pelagimonas varians]